MNALLTQASRGIAELYQRGESWLMDSKHATYGAAVARIILGLVVVVFVLANLSASTFLWGPGSSWVEPIRHQTSWAFPFVFFTSGDPGWVFLIKFALLGIAGLALLLGWHGRIAAFVVLFLMISLMSTNPVAYDQTDNAFRILLFYFCFTDLSGRWSLDARRRARRARPVAWVGRVAPWAGTTLHNVALVAVAAQIFIIYGVAGLSKVSGSQWQDGTAVYYPLHLESLSPWPGLNEVITSNALAVNVVTYLSVFIQIFFPLLLLQRWTRIIALICIVGMHAGIGILMGIPLFSLSMMAADGIFIRDETYERASAFVRREIAPRLPAWTRSRGTSSSIPVVPQPATVENP
jgi:hypothetical protein